MTHASRFGWRQKPEWSGQDWTLHRDVEKLLRQIVHLLPSNVDITVPYCPLKPIDAESFSNQAVHFYLNYAFDLNAVVIQTLNLLHDYEIEATDAGTIAHLKIKGTTVSSRPFPSLVYVQIWMLTEVLESLKQRA